MNDDIKRNLKIFDKELAKQNLSRRDALKLLGLTTGTTLFGATEAQSSTEIKATSNAQVKIVIVGGGLAGISTASRLCNILSNAEITIIEPNQNSVSYQPGNTFIGGGIYQKKDVMYDTKDFIPSGVKMVWARATDFDPDNDTLATSTGEVISYDFLVVAAGLVFDFTQIKGLEAIGENYTLGKSDKLLETLKNSGASTIYNVDSAVQTWKNMQETIKEAKDGKKVNAVFTHPHTAIKCGGAPKKIMYLMNSRLEEAGNEAKKNTTMSFYPNSNKLFGVKEYADAITEQFKKRDFNWNFNHNLIEVDLKNKVATFDNHWEEKGEYDSDLEEYDMIQKNRYVEVPYDFLHITPPAKAPDEIGKSKIGSGKGWVPVNKETLQHVSYKNIFSLGDIAAVPLGKTGGSVRKQYKVLCDNLISAIEGEKLEAKYDGYTVCPIITSIGTVMMAEFDYTMKPTPSFPLDPTKERYIWWLLKAYILKPMTQYGMLNGRI